MTNSETIRYSKQAWIKQLNNYGSQKEACFFIISYDTQTAYVLDAKQVKESGILFEFNEIQHCSSVQLKNKAFNLSYTKQNFKDYEVRFNKALLSLKRGDSFLLNLTCETPIITELSLKEIFYASKAKYKVMMPNNWVCFSPESFIQVAGKTISTFPMKGTISANIPNAKSILLHDSKEKAEHVTVVDLLRNDLSQIAKSVKVDRFRYIEEVGNENNKILQCSSQISGELENNWYKYLGDYIAKLLPAGSICGAPKDKTVRIINSIENHKRGFYTGIAGYFDGKNLNSCVLIRFIEERGSHKFYKSGGGITHMSKVCDEYEELYKKIYVPIR